MTAPLTTDGWDRAPDPLTRREVLVLRTRERLERRMVATAFAIAAAAFMVALALAYLANGMEASSGRGAMGEGAVGRMTLPATVRDSPVIYDTAVMPLAPEEASAINAKRPVDVAKLVPAAALRVAAGNANATGYAAALRCLTQAIYYEAASEPADGQRAVAQVVLNRVRHPAFPNTVCGVVYQGSQRVTGCQFSFTCDGSLARIPSLGGWARAEGVARDALSGKVAAAVGNATHYHANYVVPYWAPTLDKAATIGAHIFYIMRGFLGSPRAFRSHYDVALEAPQVATAVLPDVLPTDQPGLIDPLQSSQGLNPGFRAPAEDARSGRLIQEESAQGLNWNAPSGLRADENRGEIQSGGGGTLKADEAKARSSQPAAEATAPAPK